MSANKERAALLWFGLAGHVIEFRPTRLYSRSSLSGYDSPELCLWELDRGKYDHYEIGAGLPVLDKRAALETNAARAFRSPLLDLTIDDRAGTIDRFADKARDSIIATALRTLDENPAGFGAYIRAHDATTAAQPTDAPGPLDQVGLLRYLTWWSENGGRLGVLQKDSAGWFIRWDNADETRGENPYADMWRKAGNL